MRNIYLFGIIILVLGGCFSPSEEILKSFKTISNSLDKSSEYQSDKLKSLIDTISNNRDLNILLANKADTIYSRTKQLVDRIESIKLELQIKDTVGDNLDNSSELIVNTKKGRDLYNQLIRYHEFALNNLVNNIHRKNIDSLSINFPEKYSQREWLELNFKSVPTIAATTLLSKYQNDCISTGEILLLDIRNEIRK